MRAGPISTQIKVAQCQKCHAYIFNATVAGLDAAIDPVPLREAEEVRNALLAGRGLYHVSMLGGKPNKAFHVIGSQVAKSIEHGSPLWAQHPCMAAGTVRATKVEAPPQGPQRAPVTPGGHPDGLRRPTAPVGGSQGHTAKITMEDYWGVSRSPARNVIPRPSRCCVCRKLLTGQEPGATTIEYNGRIVWGMHEH